MSTSQLVASQRTTDHKTNGIGESNTQSHNTIMLNENGDFQMLQAKMGGLLMNVPQTWTGEIGTCKNMLRAGKLELFGGKMR